MTVKEIVEKFHCADKLYLGYSGSVFELDRENILVMDAFGGYLVDYISPACDKNSYEIYVTTKFLKAEGVTI